MGLEKVEIDKFVPSLSTIEIIDTLNEINEKSIETLFNNDIEPIIRKTTTK